MKILRERKDQVWLVFLAVAASFLAGIALRQTIYAQPQSQEPGPQPNVGETTIAPKTAQPAPVPETKRPERINPSEIYTLSTSTNLVSLDVMVKDKDGNPIQGLGRKNFKVFDDGVEQNVSNFGTGQEPLTLAMVIEFANRNIWNQFETWAYLYQALQDAYAFLNVMQPKDWVAVVSFDMKPQIITDFTQDRYEVKGALDQLRIPGFSEANLYDALAFTIDRMKDIQGRKAILAICTGVDTFSKLTYPEMLKIAKASDTAIYPISTLEWYNVMTGMHEMQAATARNQLNYIAQYSGGQAYFPRFQAELPDDYQQIAGQIRTQYSLGFIPSNAAKDGRYHKLKVELVDDTGSPLRIPDKKGKPIKYRLVARDGYYAPKS